jgi:hypothetical protein
MSQSRRHVVASLVGAAGILAASPLLLAGLPMQSHTPQPIPSPNAPNQNFPPGLNGPDNRLPSDHKNVDPKKQEELKNDVQKLFELASELKSETEKADLNSMLPVNMIKKAQQIEKLAKQIKQLSQG